MNLTVLKNLLKDDLFSSFVNSWKTEEAFCDFLAKLFESGYEENFYAYAEKLILYDDNALSRRCAEKKHPSAYLENAYKQDLKNVLDQIYVANTQGKYGLHATPVYPFDKGGDVDKTYANLCKFYEENGYGIFIENSAFRYDNGLIPLANPSKITLSELKDYQTEKRQIEDNVINFLKNLPYSDMLLYGEKGTGKSSTFHAVLNKYAKFGLKVVEINKRELNKISEISRYIGQIPLKFIIFIDDLSIDDNDDLSSLKASLEGSLSTVSSNAMIVATSNRRHIVKENFSERQDSVHAVDAMEEQLSLSDRFGLTVMFSSTNKEQYLSIVKQLAADLKLKTDEKKLCDLSERWAILKGGRSPRRARQFIDLAYSCEVRGEEISF